MTIDQYVQRILSRLPTEAEYAFDPERLQTVLAARITDNYGETNRTPKYPRNPKGTTLQLVNGNLFKAATVYRAKGNVSKTEAKAGTYSFVWGIDLAVIPYARIHEYGGQAGRNHAATIPPRPYIEPSIKAMNDKDLGTLSRDMLRRLLS
jgi:phage gpG-like protein